MPNTIRRVLYATVVFWSALLLLLVQPIITKSILPWFGGSAGVWTTCMLFFQFVLLLGYLYAHLITRMLPVRMQATLHVVLMVAALAFLPLHASERWKPTESSDPVWYILVLLLVTAGLPYFLLSTTSPLLQSWYSRTLRTDLPWRLFAISNLGSLVSLLAYPVLIEPRFTVTEQLGYWSAGFAVFVVLCACAAFVTGREAAPVEPIAGAPFQRILIWAGLAAIPSVLWLGAANQLSQDVAAIPFLWILPLSLYLLSFVLTFDSDKWYRPRAYRFLMPVGWGALLWVGSQQGTLKFEYTIVLYTVALFFICMFCHGEVARLKPDSRQLTSYYLTISVGGAIGGIFVGIIAPKLFNQYMEVPIAMLASIVAAIWLLYNIPRRMAAIASVVVVAGIATGLLTDKDTSERTVKYRNFYGTVQITEDVENNERYRQIYNGAIKHGLQFLSPTKARTATTYYGVTSGAALALKELQAKGPVRVGVIGLGAGTMAAYARPGDYFRFYDINPLVIELAQREFTFLSGAPQKIDVVQGDARLSLEREEPQKFDLLCVDAFSGDSIPVHLLTKEAFAQYFRHLAPGGVLAVHVTNKHLELAPVVKLLASDQRAHSRLIINTDEDERQIYGSDWVVVTRDENIDNKLAYLSSPIPGSERLRMWTDDSSNLFTILKADR